MKVFPQAIAFAHIQIGTIAGKLNGVMPATTPSGCRISNTSTPVETCSEKPPFSRCGIAVAYSTFSSPRCTSPIASESTLPCCDVRTVATSVLRASSSSRIANMISARLDSDVARQAGSASLAASTAWFSSATSAKSTSCVCSPVAGSYTGPRRPDSPGTCLPPM